LSIKVLPAITLPKATHRASLPRIGAIYFSGHQRQAEWTLLCPQDHAAMVLTGGCQIVLRVSAQSRRQQCIRLQAFVTLKDVA
jgi:hypothetical protein